MNEKILEAMELNPIIGAVRNPEDIPLAVRSPVSSVFLLKTDIISARYHVEELKKNGKNVFIHMEFIEGLGRDNRAMEYVSKIIRPDGIITTRTTHIKFAKDLGLFTILRFFMVDSQSFETAVKSLGSTEPDMVEIMPAILPSVIGRLKGITGIPIIAGGLVKTKEELIEILKAGALAVSTGKRELWYL